MHTSVSERVCVCAWFILCARIFLKSDSVCSIVINSTYVEANRLIQRAYGDIELHLAFRACVPFSVRFSILIFCSLSVPRPFGVFFSVFFINNCYRANIQLNRFLNTTYVHLLIHSITLRTAERTRIKNLIV